jgi:autotransporter-associated beta strand protein
VFNGHDHYYATARLDDGDGNPNDDTYQVVVGTAGAPLYTLAGYTGDNGSWTVVPYSSESQYGYLRVVVDDVAQTVVQTWVHRLGVNTFVDTANVVSYTYGPTWTNSAASGNWSGAGNWNTGAVPFNGAAVTFGTGGSTCDVDSVSRTVDTIIFNRAADFVVSSSGGAGLTINRGVTVTNTYTSTIVAPITLGRPNTWAVPAAGTLQVSGNISGTNSLTKTGSGTLTLSGANTYSGSTAVSNGCLGVTGSLGTGAVTVASGATLAGNGVIGGLVTIAAGGTLAPTGVLTINSPVTISSSATLNYHLGNVSDQIAVTGSLQFGGTLNITDNGGFGVGTYTLFSYTGTLTNNGLSIGTTPDASWVYQLDTNATGQVRLIVLTPLAAWQTLYFGSTTSSAAAADADPDGDGLSNEAEFYAGSNPTNSASALRITAVTVEGDNIRVNWATFGGHTNQVEYLLPLGAGGDYQSTNQLWGAVAPAVIVSGSGDVTTNVVDIGGATSAPSRYYRVRLLP